MQENIDDADEGLYPYPPLRGPIFPRQTSRPSGNTIPRKKTGWYSSLKSSLRKSRGGAIKNPADDYVPKAAVDVSRCWDECKLCPRGLQKNHTKVYNRGVELALEEKNELWGTIVGTPADVELSGDLYGWFVQPLSFSHKIPWGIHQVSSGPCGVLAAIQGYFMKQLLFLDGCRHPSYMDPPESDEDIWTLKMIANCCSVFIQVLAEALAIIMYRSTASSSYYWISLAPYKTGNVIDECASQDDNYIREILNTVLVDEIPTLLSIKKLEILGVKKLVEHIATVLHNDSNPLACLEFVLSVVFTRGCDNVKRDSDLYAVSNGSLNAALITNFGQTSQELVNLILTGECVTNIGDGTIVLKDDVEGTEDQVELKGVESHCDVGCLASYGEDYMRIGRYMKYPRYPIWIIAEHSHYRIMFSDDIQVAKDVSNEIAIDKALKRFDAIDTASIGMVEKSSIHNLMILLTGSEDFVDEQDERVYMKAAKDGILLRSDFLNAFRSVNRMAPRKRWLNEDNKEEIGFYIYDGLTNPRITTISVEDTPPIHTKGPFQQIISSKWRGTAKVLWEE